MKICYFFIRKYSPELLQICTVPDYASKHFFVCTKNTHISLQLFVLWAALLWLEWFFSINGLWKYPLVLAKYCDYPNVYGYHTKGYACFLLFFSMFLIMLTMQLQCAISVGGKCIFTKAWYITTASVTFLFHSKYAS